MVTGGSSPCSTAPTPTSGRALQAEAKTSIRADCFPMADWGDDVYVVPEHAFGVIVTNSALALSEEHRAYAWLTADEAMARVTFDSSKTAIWELHECLRRNGAGSLGRGRTASPSSTGCGPC